MKTLGSFFKVKLFLLVHKGDANLSRLFSYDETALLFAVAHKTDSAAAAAIAGEKMIMLYNQELFGCNGVCTKHHKAPKWIQRLRGHILPTNKPAVLAASLPMAVSHLHVSCGHSPVGLLLP